MPPTRAVLPRAPHSNERKAQLMKLHGLFCCEAGLKRTTTNHENLSSLNGVTEAEHVYLVVNELFKNDKMKMFEQHSCRRVVFLLIVQIMNDSSCQWTSN